MKVQSGNRVYSAPVNSRSAYIFKKSKEVVAQKSEDSVDGGEIAGRDSAGASKLPSTQPTPVEDFTSQEELVSHIQVCYCMMYPHL